MGASLTAAIRGLGNDADYYVIRWTQPAPPQREGRISACRLGSRGSRI